LAGRLLSALEYIKPQPLEHGSLQGVEGEGHDKKDYQMRTAILAGAFAALFAAVPAFAQSAAYPTPDNNFTRTDDVDPSEAPYMNEELGQPSDSEPSLTGPNDGIIVDDGGTGEGSGESGEGTDLPPPPDTPPQ
jgi:hypothetical protein